MRTSVLTLLTLLAFAGNSILCRTALGARTIDPYSFTTIRIASGALVLLPFLRPSHAAARSSSLRAGAALFVYALAFSLAYVSLDAGTGALLLFGTVQITMIGTGLARGERPSLAQAAGLALAVIGVVLLVAPGVTAPAPAGAALMTLAGAAWGVYSLLGRGAPDPRAATARNFAVALAPAALVTLLAPLLLPPPTALQPRGVLLAATSGALTSGLGYVLWYAALRGHTATSAAIVQLAVPVLAALGGVALLDEGFTGRLALASVLTLGGVALAVARPRP